MVEVFLFAIIFLQFVYMIYSDLQNRAERERFTLKLMSKDVAEYTSAVKPEMEEVKTVEEMDPYATIEEAGVQKILKAEVS